MKISYTVKAERDMVFLEKNNSNLLKRIYILPEDIKINRYTGIGKPEALKGGDVGWYSRRIDYNNRLVYRIINDDIIEISSARGHYADK